MLAYKFTERDLSSKRFAWNQLHFYMNYLHHHLPEVYPGLQQTSKIEVFAIIVDGKKPLIITAKLSILDNSNSPEYTSDLREAAYETLFRSKVKSALLRDAS